MPIRFDELVTGGALQGAVARSLIRTHEAHSELAPGDRVGIYRVIAELGRGGMAIVYLAERADGEYEQRIALKWMQAQNGSEAETLFRRERQAMANLRHPHIARLLDGGRTDEGRPWFAMELIEGDRLDQHCVNRRVSREVRLRLFLQVCSAVAFAHAHGVLHRDLKPSNVLVEPDGNAKLLDFGIAQMLGEHDELAAHACTPGFASPEQQRGEALTVASDVWQLGRLLATLLSADEREHTRILTRLDTQAPTRIHDLANEGSSEPALPAGLGEDLQAILRKAIADDPGQRYAGVTALAEDVQAVLEHRPVRARPRKARYLAARFVRRHPLGVAVSTMALVLMMVGASWFTWRLGIERDAALGQARLANTVLEFMREDLLAAADPAAAPGRELSVRQALDIASAAAGNRFSQSPETETAVRITLAGLYEQLGDWERAESEARLAVGLSETMDPSGELVFESQRVLAGVLTVRDSLDEAERLLDALAARSHPDSALAPLWKLSIDNNIALLRYRQGEYAESARLHREVLDATMRIEGPDSPRALEVGRDLAASLLMLGKHDEASALYEHAFANHQSRLGPLHPVTLDAAHMSGTLLRHRGAFDAALSRLREALAGRIEVLGSAHPFTMASRNEVATVLQELKRYDEAEPLFREVLDMRLQVLGESHQHTRNAMSNLGLLYSLWGKPELAAPLVERALALDQQEMGEHHPDALATMHNLAGLYRRQSRMDAALAMHRRAIEGARAELGDEAWQTALFRVGHALTLQAMDRLAEAELELVKAIGILESSLGAEHARTIRAREMLAELRAAIEAKGSRK